jgi:hypothetical protein
MKALSIICAISTAVCAIVSLQHNQTLLSAVCAALCIVYTYFTITNK